MIAFLEQSSVFVPLLNFVIMVGVGLLTLFMRLKLAELKADLRGAIDDSGQEIDERIDSLRREIGETIAALRAKIGEVEIYVRDHYVRRDEFFHVSAEFKESMKSELGKVEKRLEVIEGVLRERRKGD